ncbi:MAG: DedA family protein [Solirubrobacteraceae bacterium]|nr:DedA family protein [Solirubrobacteraceae bacterium]
MSPSIGLPALFALVLGESAGLPLPGETALIASGGLAADGQVSLLAVIVVAASAAIIGDMIGYWIGRRGGRKLLLRDGRFSGHRRAAVAKADKYFAKYGVVTVFFARFVPGVRVVGAITAGATKMRWRSFAIANALGCITWATTVASIAYAAGPTGAVVLIILGFSIAGLGLVMTWINVRRGANPLDEDPLVALEAYATSVSGEVPPATQPEPAPTSRHATPSITPRATPAAPPALAACANRLP